MRAWQRAEKRTAVALGGRRVTRERFESAPDVADVPGFAVEVKYRKRLPRLVVEALRQAEGYAILGARPVAVLFERGSREGIAVLRLADFATIARNPDSRPGKAADSAGPKLGPSVEPRASEARRERKADE